MNQVGLPEPVLSEEEERIPHVIQEQIFSQDTREEMRAQVADRMHTLNDDQLEIYGLVEKSVFLKLGRAFCLNAAGGTGKTYLVNFILDRVRLKDRCTG